MKKYKLKVAGLERDLPIIRLNENLSIASFVILGDSEIVSHTARELATKLPKVDAIVTAEAKGIPLAHELSKLLGLNKYIVARKSVKAYMEDPLIYELESITTSGKQILCLDGKDARYLRGKKVALIDDVISTGASLEALKELVELAEADIIAQAAILAEGDAAKRKDIIFLEELPIFD